MMSFLAFQLSEKCDLDTMSSIANKFLFICIISVKWDLFVSVCMA